jgi:hypothetical protein
MMTFRIILCIMTLCVSEILIEILKNDDESEE